MTTTTHQPARLECYEISLIHGAVRTALKTTDAHYAAVQELHDLAAALAHCRAAGIKNATSLQRATLEILEHLEALAPQVAEIKHAVAAAYATTITEDEMQGVDDRARRSCDDTPTTHPACADCRSYGLLLHAAHGSPTQSVREAPQPINGPVPGIP